MDIVHETAADVASFLARSRDDSAGIVWKFCVPYPPRR